MRTELNEQLKNIYVDEEEELKYNAQFIVDTKEELIKDMKEFMKEFKGVKRLNKITKEYINKIVDRDYIENKKEYVYSDYNRQLVEVSNVLKKEKQFYHYTTKEKLKSILNDMILDSPIGNYVCDTKKDVLKFLSIKLETNAINLEDAIVIVFTTNTALEVSTDHNRDLIDASAYVSYNPIKIECIKDILEFN